MDIGLILFGIIGFTFGNCVGFFLGKFVRTLINK